MATKPTGSRIVKNEQQKALKQTIVWGAISLGILLVFLFLILPYAPKLLASLVEKGGSITQEDTIPPQVPVFNSPPQATNLAQIELSGFAEPDSSVLLVLNGNEAAEVLASEDGTFAQTIDLQEGDNTVAAYSKDAADNESALSREYTIVLDTEAPTLTLPETLVDGAEIVGKENKLFTITGTTEPNAKVAINDRFLFARADGTFSYQLQLTEGENTINFVITDKANNQFEQSLKITYKP